MAMVTGRPVRGSNRHRNCGKKYPMGLRIPISNTPHIAANEMEWKREIHTLKPT
jgi:hypothetical protein